MYQVGKCYYRSLARKLLQLHQSKPSEQKKVYIATYLLSPRVDAVLLV